MEPIFFRQPAFVAYGFGASSLAGKEARALGLRHVLLITDRGVRSAGLIDGVSASLESAGVAYTVYDGVGPNPETTMVEEALALLREEGADGVVAVGGGSPMDAGKGVAFLAANGGRLQDYIGAELPKPALPCIAIPTTAGTSSEVTNNMVFTDPATRFKFSLYGPNCAAARALIDPELTLSMPPGLTAATGMDALTHAIESYTSKGAYDLTRALALDAIALIGRWLPVAVAHGEDREARERMMMACFEAGVAFNQSKITIVHSLSHPVSGWCGTPHGVANAVLLPHVMAYNAPHAAEAFAAIARALGVDTVGLSSGEAAQAAVEQVRGLNDALGIPKGLGACGVTAERIEDMATDAMKSGGVRMNPRPVTRDDLVALYRQAM